MRGNLRRELNMRGASPLLMTGLMILILTACSGGSSSRGFSERVVSGVRERTYHSPHAPRIDPYSLELEAVYGKDRDEGTYHLIQPHVVGVGPDQSLYVIDGRVSAIHRFADKGNYLGSYGRRGGGPGEFSGGGLMGYVHNGEIVVYDAQIRRLSFFSLEGTFLRALQMSSLSSFALPVPYHLSGGIRYMIWEMGGSISRDYERNRFKVMLMNEQMALSETLIDTTLQRDMLKVGARTVPPPFTRFGPAVATAPDMPLAWWFPGRYRLEFMDPFSRDRWAVSIPVEQAPLTSEMKEVRIGLFAGSGLEEEARRNLRFPSHLPYISQMSWSSNGWLWVLNYVPFLEIATSFEYNVFSREGEWLFSQKFPVRPDYFTDQGIYVETEATDGSPLIEFYRLVEK